LKEITVDATIDNISIITEFIDNELEVYNCPENEQVKVNIAIDELVANIAKYAYGEDKGKVTVQLEVNEKSLSISFIDGGIPYNPLEHEEPDVTLSVEERQIGGLGIYLVKKLMDEMTYNYIDGKNVLKIQKNF